MATPGIDAFYTVLSGRKAAMEVALSHIVRQSPLQIKHILISGVPKVVNSLTIEFLPKILSASHASQVRHRSQGHWKGGPTSSSIRVSSIAGNIELGRDTGAGTESDIGHHSGTIHKTVCNPSFSKMKSTAACCNGKI